MFIRFDNIQLSVIKSQSSLFNKNKQTEERPILKSISGYFSKGINAILGSSGAGKTSLLNIIAKRMEKGKNIRLTGQVKINGEEYNYKQFNNVAGYVMQEDYLLPTLTIKEYLQFAADMKLTCPKQERVAKVANLIKRLQLTRCQDTLIGDQFTKGISGGERKRCSIGMELIGEPQILILDEPTSGLDSFTSYQLISLLKNIAERDNCTIVFTIHQPSSDIWNLFDRITLITEGRFIYQGEGENILNYFNNINFTCPQYSNPADYYMSIMSGSNQISKDRINVLIEQYDKNLSQRVQEQVDQITQSINLRMNKNDNQSLTNYKSQSITKLFMIQVLLLRQIKLLSRNKIMIYARFFQVISMSLFTGAVYYNLSRQENSYQDSYNISVVLYILMLGMFSQSENPQVINFSAERPIYLKEVNSNLYTTGAYFISKVIPELVSCSIFPLIASLIIYWMVGLTSSAYPFFLLVYILQSNIGNSFGILSGSIFDQPKIAISFAVTFIIPQLLFGGLLKNRKDLASWIGWIQYVTPTFYAFNAATVNEFERSDFEQNPIEYMNLDLDKWFCVGMLVLLYFLFNFIAYLILLSKKKNLE